MHPLLQRQVRRAFGEAAPRGAEWERLIDVVSGAYLEADDQRRMVESSLRIMSDELHARNLELQVQLRAVAEQARVLENLHDAAIVLDHHGRVLECYAATFQLFGSGPEALVGRSLAELLRPADPGLTSAQVAAQLRRRGRWSGDTVFVRRDGVEGVLETTLLVFRRSGRTRRRVLAVARDVTERRQMDRQLLQSQKLDAIGQLAAGVAHEINTPAQYVADNLQYLEDAFGELASSCPEAHVADSALARITDEIPRAIAQSLEGMTRIADIVRGIKLFAHPGSGSKVPVDLNREVESTIAVTRNEWKYVADLDAELDPDLPFLPGFPGDIGHVVLNLIVNAAHAIGEKYGDGRDGRGHITVATRRAGAHAEIRVTDDGNGIPPAIQSRIFDPFFTTKAVGKGTGQGLALSQRIVHEKHGGTLLFESSPGRGTTFVVSLPLGPLDDHGEEPARAGTEAA